MSTFITSGHKKCCNGSKNIYLLTRVCPQGGFQCDASQAGTQELFFQFAASNAVAKTRSDSADIKHPKIIDSYLSTVQPLKLHTITLLYNYRKVQFATQLLNQCSSNLDV